jgi:hypothetical protein
LLILRHISSLSRINFFSNSARLLLVGLVLLLPITSWSVVGVMAATVVALLFTIRLYRREFSVRKIGQARLSGDDVSQVNAKMIEITKPLVLPGIFFHVQGVVTVFLVSLFGTASMLADVGAIGRLSMVLLVADRVTGTLLFPAIARASAGRQLLSILFRAHLAYFAMMGLVLLTSVCFPHYWILLLGSKYTELAPLVWMVFVTAILQNAANFAFRSLTVRGETRGQSLGIPVMLATQVFYLALNGVSDLRSVLGFGIATSMASFGYQYLLLVMRWPTLKEAAA